MVPSRMGRCRGSPCRVFRTLAIRHLVEPTDCTPPARSNSFGLLAIRKDALLHRYSGWLMRRRSDISGRWLELNIAALCDFLHRWLRYWRFSLERVRASCWVLIGQATCGPRISSAYYRRSFPFRFAEIGAGTAMRAELRCANTNLRSRRRE